MSYQFNAFSTPVENTATRISFAVGPEMVAEYPDALVRIVGTGLTYNATTGAMTGTITSIELYDPNFGDGAARQTISIAEADQTTLAATISTFLGGAIGLVDDTFGAWGLVAGGFDHLGDISGVSATTATIELRDGSDNVIGHLRMTGTGFDDVLVLDRPASLATITEIEHLDANGDPIAGESVSYAPALSLAQFSYGLLKLGIPDLGNDEELYPVLVSGDNTITKFDDITGYNAFQGGPGNDNFVSTDGGHVVYSDAVASVVIDMSAGTATGGGGSDSWDPNWFGGATGSQFDDTITGGSGNGYRRGDGGSDLVTTGSGHDVIDGGSGNDTLDGGDGDDLMFGGAGSDTVHGGANLGDNFNGVGDGTDDVLFYSHIGTPPDYATTEFGEGAEDYTDGIVVTFAGTGSGTVTGADVGTDTFDGIEEVWGSQNADTFNGGNLGSENVMVGMGGNDTFNGGDGQDIVNYDNEVYDYRLVGPAIDGAITAGVTVNMSGVERFGVAAGHALDMFGDTDTLVAIDDVYGTFFNDIIIGDDAANELLGREGKDLLEGGAGNDTLQSGLDKDTLVGGAGNDRFVFAFKEDSGKTATTRDVISDFEHLVDDIDLSGIDANTKKALDQGFKLIGSQDFHKKAGELRVVKMNKPGTANDMTIVEGDVNGDGRADFRIELTGLKAVTSDDFVL